MQRFFNTRRSSAFSYSGYFVSSRTESPFPYFLAGIAIGTSASSATPYGPTMEASFFISHECQGIPSSAVIDSTKLYIEHHEEEGISTNPLIWAAGGGSLTSLTTLVSQSPAVLPGPGAEATVEWNVSPWINTAARVNDLKLTVRNNAGNGKKTRNDRVYVIVTYHEP
jgi:hypothetical protein